MIKPARRTLGGRKPRPVQALLPAVDAEIRARAARPTYASIPAAARLAGIPERKAREWIGAGRVRTSKSAGETLACIEDLDRIALAEGWAVA